MNNIKSRKAFKCTTATLISLMLVSAFVASCFGRLPSDSPYYQQEPMPEPIIMWAVVTTDPYWGYYGGYHDMLYAIKDELIKIGIDLRIKMYDSYTWWDIVWDEKWNVPGDADNNPGTYTYGVDGWDFFCSEWGINPTSYIWVDELAYSYMTPPAGYNVMSWMNEEADYLFHEAMTTLDSDTHKQYMWLWQEEFMHDPPVINIYYPEVMTARTAYVEGYDDTTWGYDITQMRINTSVFDAVAPTSRKQIGSNTMIYGTVEPVWSWNPLRTMTYTEETLNWLKYNHLYRQTRENLEFPPSGKCIVKPTITADFPTWHTCSELGYTGYAEDYPVARVPIREGIIWTDGVEFNATDLKFTFDAILDKTTGGYAYADYYHLLVDVVANDTYIVDFILYETDYDFAAYNAHAWGLGYVPYHQMKDVPHSGWKNHPTNFDPYPVSMGGAGLECIGPYVPIDFVPDVMINFVRFDVYMREYRDPPLPTYSWSDYYWGKEGWGTQLPEYYMVKFIPDAADRLIALQTLEVDDCGYPTAPIETWEAMKGDPKFRVFTYPYSSSNPLWMNLKNPILSNRYVRLAIAHAIPYNYIFDEILPGWGISQAYPGKTFVLPMHESFHPTLPAYEYDIDKAKMYMDMWRYGQADTTYTKGPVGDTDLSGIVRTADHPIWVDNIGTTPPEWVFLPSNDIDPDHDNSGYVELEDFFEWRDNIGNEYPFPGAR